MNNRNAIRIAIVGVAEEDGTSLFLFSRDAVMRKTLCREFLREFKLQDTSQRGD